MAQNEDEQYEAKQKRKEDVACENAVSSCRSKHFANKEPGRGSKPCVNYTEIML